MLLAQVSQATSGIRSHTRRACSTAGLLLFMLAPIPALGQRYFWWVGPPLDVEAMHEAAQLLVGEHDFASLRNRSKGEAESTRRTLRALQWRREGSHVTFQVIGDGFLYRMVRNLVGVLVDVGRGKLPGGDVTQLLAFRDRRQGGPTAPPQGLYLMDVAYPATGPCVLDPFPPLF